MAPAFYTLKARCPKSGALTEVRLTAHDLDRVLRHQPEHKFLELSGDRMTYTGSCVQEVLENPVGIYGGVRRFQEGGLCYCGIPSRRWLNGGHSAPPPPGMVFVVYVNPRMQVFEWRWEKGDAEDPRRPAGYRDRNRFTEGRIWPPD